MGVRRPVHQQVGLAGERHPSLRVPGVGRSVERRRAEPDMAGQVFARVAIDPRRLVAHRHPEGVQPPDQRGEDVVAAVGEDELQAGVPAEHALDDEGGQVHEVVQRHERRVSRIGVGVPGEGGRIVDAVATVDVHRHRQPVGGGGLPDRLEHRFAVGLAGLHRDADLHQLRVIGQALDLRDGALGVFGIDADGAPESVGGVGLEPAVEQPVVDCGADPAVEQVVGDVAARQRVEDGVVDTLSRTDAGRRSAGRTPGSAPRRGLAGSRRRARSTTAVRRRESIATCGRRADSAVSPRWSGNAAARWHR